MSILLGLAVLVVGVGLLIGFGVVDRVVRWLLPAEHWMALAEKGAQVRERGEREVEMAKVEASAQAEMVGGVLDATGLPAWAMIVVGVVLLGLGVLAVGWVGLLAGWW